MIKKKKIFDLNKTTLVKWRLKCSSDCTCRNTMHSRLCRCGWEKQQLWCLIRTPPFPPCCESGLWAKSSLGVSQHGWPTGHKRLKPEFSSASSSRKAESPLTKWALPHGYRADFAPRSCSRGSGTSIKITCYASLLREGGCRFSRGNSDSPNTRRSNGSAGYFVRKETVLMAFQVKGKGGNVYRVASCSRPAGALTGFSVHRQSNTDSSRSVDCWTRLYTGCCSMK